MWTFTHISTLHNDVESQKKISTVAKTRAQKKRKEKRKIDFFYGRKKHWNKSDGWKN